MQTPGPPHEQSSLHMVRECPRKVTMTKSKKTKQGKNSPAGRSIVRSLTTQDAQTLVMSPGAGQSMAGNRGGARVTNSEIIATLQTTITSGLFPAGGAATTFRFGTGGGFSSATWLGQLGALYDKYKVNRLKLVFQPAMPTTTAGTVALWFDSDPGATAQTFAQSSGNMDAKTGAVYQPLALEVPRSLLNRLPEYLTQLGTAAEHLETSTVGVAQVAWSSGIQSGISGAVTLGYLWATYDVSLNGASNPAS